jgi:hypothetical protein
VSAIIPISSEEPACLIGAPRIGRSATIAARDWTWVFTGFEKNYPGQAASHFGPTATASRVSSKSKSYRCHAPVANPSSDAFTFRGHQHEEIANDHHN